MAKSDIRALGKLAILSAIENDKGVINADKLIDMIQRNVTLEDMSQEEIERAVIVQNLYPLFYEMNWASVIRGKKYFINLEMCNNPVYFDKVIENSSMDIETKRQAKFKKQAFKKAQCEDIEHQMVINFETGNAEEERSIEDILEMLSMEA